MNLPARTARSFDLVRPGVARTATAQRQYLYLRLAICHALLLAAETVFDKQKCMLLMMMMMMMLMIVNACDICISNLSQQLRDQLMGR